MNNVLYSYFATATLYFKGIINSPSKTYYVKITSTHLGAGADDPRLEQSPVILHVLLGDGEGSHGGHAAQLLNCQVS